MSRFASLLLVVLSAGCASSTPRAEGPAGPELTLQFAWPEGVTAKVRSDQRKSRGGQEFERSVVTEKRSWERSGSELLIRATEVDVEGDDQRATMLEQMTPPTDVVDATTGRFLRLDDVDAAVSALQSAISEGGEGAANSDAMTALLKSTLVSAAESDWDNAVGFWVGRTVTIGRGGKEERIGPGLPGSERMKLTYAYRAERAIPCNGRSLEQKCVLLTVEVTPDREQLPEIGNRFIQAMEAAAGREGAEAPPISDFQLTTHLELVTEPQTLLPHRFLKKVAMTVEFDIPGRGKVKMEQAESDEAVYTYDPAR